MGQLNESKNKVVSIIVPTYQEVENIRLLIIQICRTMSFIGKAFEIIVVDDNSRDGIDEEVARLSEEGYPVDHY